MSNSESKAQGDMECRIGLAEVEVLKRTEGERAKHPGVSLI